jgi:hypothetical protein
MAPLIVQIAVTLIARWFAPWKDAAPIGWQSCSRLPQAHILEPEARLGRHDPVAANSR